MVDLVVLQSVSYVAASIGVCAAAMYYILTLRNQTLLRKSQLVYTLWEKCTNEEWIKRSYTDLLQWHWDDFDDFERKYGLDVNPEAFNQRHASFQWGNIIGNLLMKGLIDRELIYKTIPFVFPQLWSKFGPIIEEQRVRYNFGPDFMVGFEYLANEMNKMWEASVTGPPKPFAESIEY